MNSGNIGWKAPLSDALQSSVMNGFIDSRRLVLTSGLARQIASLLRFAGRDTWMILCTTLLLSMTGGDNGAASCRT